MLINSTCVETFKIEEKNGEDVIVADGSNYVVRVILPNKKPGSYKKFNNQVIGVNYDSEERKKILGLREDTTIDFEFIGLSLLDEAGYIKQGAWQDAIEYYCINKFGFEPHGYYVLNAKIA
jgi:hypothetical protein